MKIELIEKKIPPPKKNMLWQRTAEASELRNKAFICIAQCKVGQHTRFTGIDRSRVLGYLQNPAFRSLSFTVCKIDENTFGAWRIK